jgi:hypothetical protein
MPGLKNKNFPVCDMRNDLDGLVSKGRGRLLGSGYKSILCMPCASVDRASDTGDNDNADLRKKGCRLYAVRVKGGRHSDM